MKLPRRGSISAEELLLLSFAGPALFCQENALFFASWPAPKCHKGGQLGRKAGSLLPTLKYSRCSQKPRGFYSPCKSPFWWDQKAARHLSLQWEGRLPRFCRGARKCRQSTPSSVLRNQSKKQTKNPKTKPWTTWLDLIADSSRSKRFSQMISWSPFQLQS